MTSCTARRSTLLRRDAIVLAHLPLAERQARTIARRTRGLAYRDDLIQVAREALIHAAVRLDPSRPAEPYLKRCIRGALLHHLRDQVRLVRIPRRVHEGGGVPLTHTSLDRPHPDGGTWLERLPAPAELQPCCVAAFADTPVVQQLDQLLEQLPAAQAAALRLTQLQGGSLRNAARQLGISATTAMRHRRLAIQNLRMALTS
jgi:RNA polymerase sigma-B factor